MDIHANLPLKRVPFIRRVSSVERAEDFRAHQRMLARFLEAGKQFRAQRTKK